MWLFNTPSGERVAGQSLQRNYVACKTATHASDLIVLGTIFKGEPALFQLNSAHAPTLAGALFAASLAKVLRSLENSATSSTVAASAAVQLKKMLRSTLA